MTACSLGGGSVQERFSKSAEEKEAERDYYDASYLRYEDHVYQERIRTVRFHQKGWEQGAPIVELGAGERVLLSFDDMEGDMKDYQYRFIHCDADWEESSLQEQEYMEGYFEDRIDDQRFSFDTELSYTHYRLELPNDRMRLTRSGNYLLYVYRDTGDIEPVLTRRFMVVAPRKMEVEGKVGRPDKMEYYDSGQQVSLRVRYPNHEVPAPSRMIHVALLQNDRWDNAVFDPPLSSIRKQEIRMGDQGDATVFPGGNEFRGFDTKALSPDAQHIAGVDRDSAGVDEVWLKTDQPRKQRGYYSDRDINGRSMIRVREASDPHLSAEYAQVHFELERSTPLPNGTVHIFGEMSEYRCLPRFRMRYDAEEGAYRKTLLLKQGYHEYMYALLPDDGGNAGFGDIEGDFYQTENSYRVLVYYRGSTDQADRLVGMERLNSREDRSFGQ